MRTRLLAPVEIRAIGVKLNDNKVIGWTERVAELLDSEPSTVKSWGMPSSSTNGRQAPGPACKLLLICAILHERGALPALMRAVDASYAAIAAAKKDAPDA